MSIRMGFKRRTRSPRTGRGTRADSVPIEQLVECVVNGPVGDQPARPPLREFAQEALHYDTRGTRVVVLGGGTGLSTVVGGNSQLPDWPSCPSVGLKEEFPELRAVVCTTDDGGSTGRLVRRLPMIGIGDLRKSCLSLVVPAQLQQAYGLDARRAHRLVRLIQAVLNRRFPERHRGWREVLDPLLAAPAPLRRDCPAPLAGYLRGLGAYVSPGGGGPEIPPAGHSLGNLLLTSAVFREARGRTRSWPTSSEMGRAVDRFGTMIGAGAGRLHPATETPGQLKFRYANGVEVYGQRKAAVTRRGFAVEWMRSEFASAPRTGAAVLKALREADLIVYAPGSLYSSMLPILQVPAIARAIRANRKALKILGANFWMQEGETDIPPEGEDRGFLVSDLIKAYARNVPGGVGGLFDVILGANLEHVPGSILRNYALEGKRPIHFDRARVENMGLEPVEATLFSLAELRRPRVVHHDPSRFALAIRALFHAWKRLGGIRGTIVRRRGPPVPTGRRTAGPRSPLLCRHAQSVEKALARKSFAPRSLRGVMEELAWENRDIRPGHLGFFRGVRVVPERRWNRSREWDKVLGYYDPQEQCLMLHEQRLRDPVRLKEDLLIALGESLLGRYIESRRWIEDPTRGYRCYEIRLRPADRRECFLDDASLRAYLRLARMMPDRREPRTYRVTMNSNEGFLPSGLLFGLMYAWYLNNAYGGIMEYEMSLLRWPERALIPHQAKERVRRERLVEFFRTEVFGRPG